MLYTCPALTPDRPDRKTGKMAFSLKRINGYLKQVEEQFEQWGQEETLELANKTLGNMKNHQSKLRDVIQELTQEINKAKSDQQKTSRLSSKSNAYTLQEKIINRITAIENHIRRLIKSGDIVIKLCGKMDSTASNIKESFGDTQGATTSYSL